jgi:CheY-like chemotaxis protein
VKPDLVSNPPIRLLAVDDDSISRHAVSFGLRKALNKPDLAENGEAALALASQIAYDVIFLDVQMPGMNGFETCAKIHATEVNRATPIVFVTCQSDFDARAKSTLSGGNDLIGKPFLIFEITVKALTLAFRGRLQRRFGTIPEIVAKPSAEVLGVSPTANHGDKTEKTNGTSEPETKSSQASETAPASKHKSREERRRARRKKVLAARDNKGRKSRHGRRVEPASRLDGNNGNGSNQEPEEESSLDNDAAETLDWAAELSADAVANAFLAQAPRHIRDLRNHFEQINQAASGDIRQEMVVNLYLAVHSLASEAELAKLLSIFQTASALEALLKTFVEDPKNSTASTLSTAGEALKLLDELCAERIMTDLAVEPSIRILLADADSTSLRVISDAIEEAFDKPECVESGEKALALATEKEFDLIFLGALMPGLDGFAVCSKIRGNGPNRQTPVVIIHTELDADARAELVCCGGNELLAKRAAAAEINLKALTLAFRARLEQVKAADAAEESNPTPAEELAVAGK